MQLPRSRFMTNGETKKENESVGTSVSFRIGHNCTQTVALTFCGVSATAEQVLIDRVFAEAGPENFAEAWLRTKALDWAADLLRDFPATLGDEP